MPSIEIRGLIDEDFVQYKKPAMVVIFPHCSFKCDRLNSHPVCQNSHLVKEEIKTVNVADIVGRYLDNPISQSIVLAGLEPLDSWEDVLLLLDEFRSRCDDDIVIYTGYTEEEVPFQSELLKSLYHSVIVKYGRYMEGEDPHIDKVLGVKLSSNNQYAVRIS